MPKPDATNKNLDNALWFPESCNWGPSQTNEVPTQGGGTAVWDSDLNDYVFKDPPTWWTECKPGDLVPSEWGVL